MELRYWLSAFQALHDRARKGELSAAERQRYIKQRDELAETLVNAQKLTLLPGQTARQCLRVARALQVDLEVTEGRARVVTQHLSSGGFGALLAREPKDKQGIGFSLRMPGSPEPLLGRANVVQSQRRDGNALVSFSFEPLSAADQERLEMVIFDTVLQLFQSTAF